jgi:hypothetical protein
MSTKNTQKLSELTEEFPVIAQLRKYFRMKGDLPVKWRNPVTKAFVQKADTDLMYLSVKYIDYKGRRYLVGKNNMRGTCDERLYAVGLKDSVEQILGTLENWGQLEDQKVFKDVFKDIDPETVDYLVFIRLIGWHAPVSEEEAIEDRYFGEKLYRELRFIIYKKPKEGWAELMAEAARIKKEREETYKFPPKEMPDFPAIHKTLCDGGKMHAFLSGGGLRVVRIDKDKTEMGYGESPNIEEALAYLEEDCLAGGRDYHKVYGKIHPHYLTGSCSTTSNLDAWIRQGRTFDCWQEGEEIVLQLHGINFFEFPEWIYEAIKKRPVINWKDKRGFVIQFKGDDGFIPGSITTKAIRAPKEKELGDYHSWYFTKTGRGPNFWKAFLAAFEAEEIETGK